MPHWRPLATATLSTALTLALTIGITGGHSPFAGPAAASAQQPIADDVAGATATPDGSALASEDPTASPSARPTKATAKATAKVHSSNSSGRSTAWTGDSGSSSTATPRPTAKPAPGPTARPTPGPTARPRSTPDPTQAPVSQSGSLHIGDGDSGPNLSWTQCGASNFAAYAVVRSTDNEIHYPAEDHDTVVAMLTSRQATSRTDSGAPNTRVWYAVWCLSRNDGEYQTIWKTPAVSYAP